MTVADTNPYPWPYDGTVDTDRLALVLVAAQPFFVDRSVGATEVLATTLACASVVRAHGGLIVHTRHGAPNRGSTPTRRPSTHLPLVGSDEWQLVTEPEPGDPVVDTVGQSAFFGSDLDALLRAAGRDQILMAGFGAEISVDCTLRAANDRGYECLVLVDAVAPFDPSTGAHALSSVTMSGGIFGALGTSSSVLATLATSGESAAVPMPTPPAPANLLAPELEPLQ